MRSLLLVLASLIVNLPVWAAPQPTLSKTLSHRQRPVDFLKPSIKPLYYSLSGTEVKVKFSASFRTQTSLEDIAKLTESEKSSMERYEIGGTMDFLFGPLSHTQLGSPQRTFQLQVNWVEAKALANGGTEIPYSYESLWIVNNILLEQPSIEIPVPYNSEIVYSPRWKRCGDSAPEHQNRSYFWYYWDPNRTGCDHVQGTHFQMTKMEIASKTLNTAGTSPEYSRMIRIKNGRPTLAMTFAFGYVEESNLNNPFTDKDIGAREFQNFIRHLRQVLPGYVETPINIQSYIGYEDREAQDIGIKFTQVGTDLDIEVKAVVNFNVDQMELFAKSYAEEHDGLFAWFGHSRVGSGFDAQNFAAMLKRYPDKLSITPDYQIIYWGGCNSYSYYTLPFFQQKATAQDPMGTKGLDIIANGLPSYFILNSINARAALQAFLHNRGKTTYTELINRIEGYARSYGITVLAVVLGDEDNAN